MCLFASSFCFCCYVTKQTTQGGALLGTLRRLELSPSLEEFSDSIWSHEVCINYQVIIYVYLYLCLLRLFMIIMIIDDYLWLLMCLAEKCVYMYRGKVCMGDRIGLLHIWIIWYEKVRLGNDIWYVRL